MTHINNTMTLAEAIALCPDIATLIDRHNARLDREAEAVEKEEAAKRLALAVGWHIKMTYRPEDRIRLANVYRKFLPYFDHNHQAAHRACSEAMYRLLDAGVLTNNKSSIKNACHIRWFIV